MALVDVIELIGPRAAEAAGLTDYATDLAERMRQHQRPDGRWYQLTDMPDLDGNYPEASATAMMACFYLAGARLGIPGCDAAIGNLSLDGLLNYSLRTGEDGRLALHDVCQVAGLGGFEGNYRDGTPGYYLSEPLAPDDAKGVGPFMMAVAERRLAQAAGKVQVAHTA